MLVPVFSFGVYPVLGHFFTLTPLRKIGLGLWVIAGSYLIVAWIEDRIMHGVTVSVWWQILAYAVLTASEVLVSITGLEFSYKQAPLRVKSFIMAATYLLSTSIGNAFTAQVNSAMVRPLTAQEITTGAETWVRLADVANLQVGQKIDIDGDTGIQITDAGAKAMRLNGTFLVGAVDPAGNRVRLADAIHNAPVASTGSFKPESTSVATYKLVGPVYFLFFAAVGAVSALLFIFVAGFYRERSHVRPAEAAA
jgi:POT family proton-dependent oligopeptide transporter